ncbi:TPA: hypothetical protein ACKTGI_003477 [Pseudomonas aeruginosa]
MKYNLLKFVFIFLLALSPFSASYSDTADIEVGCAQEVYTDSSGTSNAVTARTGKACRQDIAKNAVEGEIGTFSKPNTESIFFYFTEYTYPIYIFLAIIFSWPIFYGIFKLATYNNESEELNEVEYRNKYWRKISNCALYLFIAIVAVNPYVWFKQISFSTSLGIYSFNYMSRIEIANSEKALLNANEMNASTNDVISSVFTGIAYLSSALSEELTRRNTNRIAYVNLGTDTTDNCIVFCKTVDLSLNDFLERINSCDRVEPKYSLTSNWNTELSLGDVVWTKQNDSITFQHSEKCSSDFSYKAENYGFAKSTLKINFDIMNPSNKSYLNKDYKKNIFTVKLLQDEATKQEAGLAKQKYESYASATAAARFAQVNSGNSPDYTKVIDKSYVEQEAAAAYSWALNILNSKSDFFKDKPEAALISFMEILGERNGGFDGKNREGRDEIGVFREDALIAANELLKLECAMPEDALARVVNAVNSNGVVPFNDGTVSNITYSLMNSPLKCVKFTESGLEATTSYTAQDKDRSMKIIQNFLLKRVGYDITKRLIFNKAKGMFAQDYKKGFKASSFAANGGFGQIPEIFKGMDNSKVAGLLADSNTIQTRYSIKIDPSKKSDYIDYEIAYGQKKNENSQEQNTNDYIRLFDYVDNGIGSFTKNPSKIVGNKISNDTSLSIEQFFEYFKEQIRFCTPNINNAFGLSGLCNIWEYAPQCALSVKICWTKENLLPYFFIGALETTITLLETGFTLKVISSAINYLDSAGQVVGAISGSGKAAAIATAVGFLWNAILDPIASFLNEVSTGFFALALVYFLVFCMAFYLIYYLVRKFLILFLDIYVFNLILFFECLYSAVRGDFKALEKLPLYFSNNLVQWGLLGSYTAILGKLVTLMAPIMIGGLFEVLLTVTAKFDVASQIAFEIVGYAIIGFIMIIIIATAAYLFERLCLSLQNIFKQESHEKDGNFLAITAMVATGTATANQLSQLTDAVVKGTAANAKRLAAKSKRNK